MTPDAMRRTLDRHIAYRRRAGEIGNEIRHMLAAGVVQGGNIIARLHALANELDPPDVIMASDGVLSTAPSVGTPCLHDFVEVEWRMRCRKCGATQ